MTDTIHLIVTGGEDKGKQVSIKPDGSRMGRSSKNDVVLVDPLLSRHHCRFFFKPGEGIWITDLGSANQTFVNGKVIQEVRLRAGDQVAIGDTILSVINDGEKTADPAVAASPVVAKPAVPLQQPGGVIDLGLAADKKPDEPKPRQKLTLKPLIIIGVVVTIIAIAAWIPKVLKSHNPGYKPPVAGTRIVPQPTVLPGIIEIDYEKIEATPANIFRYKLTLAKNNMMSVQIDDLKNNRRVRREKLVDTEYCQVLAKAVSDSGFFDLAERFEGVQPNTYDSFDLSVTVGTKTHRTKVENRSEPDVFKNIRERIEEAGKNELGLVAIQYTAEKLTQMAQEAYLLGNKLMDEREIKFGNLWAAMRSLQEADWYLETVEPKPDFYKTVVAAIGDCKRELDQKYSESSFRAEKAIKMREWEEASKELQAILDLIPERSDQRNKDARKSLLEVQSHLEQKK